MLAKTRSVCARTSPSTTAPVDGSIGTCPDTNSRSPTLTACEYGPMAAGALGVLTAARDMLRR